MNLSISSVWLPFRISNRKRQNWRHQNLDAQNRLTIQPLSKNHYKSRFLRGSVCTVRLAAYQIFWTKKEKTDAMVDQNLDAQNHPDDSAPFNKSLRIHVTVWICLYHLPGCLSEFQTRKNKTDAMLDQNLHSEPRRFSPFQWITTNPGYSMNPSIPSARLPIRILNKKKT